MPQTKQTIPNNSFLDWFNDPFKKIIAIILGIASVFGLGYKTGDFKKDLQSQVELMKIRQEYNAQLEKERTNCQEIKMKLENQKIEELTKVVEELKKAKGGQNEK